MHTRRKALPIVLVLGAALLAGVPAAAQRAVPARTQRVVPARAQHRLAPAAHRMETAARQLVRTLVREMDPDTRRENNRGVRALMAAGAIAGQANALHTLTERVDDANIRLAARELFRTIEAAEEAVLNVAQTRTLRAAWNDMVAASNQVDRQLGGVRDRRNIGVEERPLFDLRELLRRLR